MAASTTPPPAEPQRSPLPQPNEEIQLQAIHSQPEHGRVEQQTEAPNTVAAITPLELTGPVKLKVFSAAFCFFNAGINDGSLGALIPYILRSYDHNTSWMAIPYGVAFFGWLLAAIFGGYLRVTLGTGGLIIVGAALQMLAQVLRFWIPPWGVFSVTWFIVALGQALQDSQANTYVSTLKNAHRWLGLIHGSYATGGLVGPLIAAAIASNFRGKWALFYCVPMGIGIINLVVSGYAFRDDTELYQRYKRGHLHGQHAEQRADATTRRSTFARAELAATLKLKSVWILSLFYFVYLGAVLTAGGWVVEFLHVARGGSLSRVGYISAAFMGGTALGRFLLAEPTFRFGEKRMLLLYALISLGLQVVFWRVPNIVVDAVTVSFIGFLLGPAFATGVSVGSKLIPQELQASGLGTSPEKGHLR